MIARGFKPVGWVAAVASAALGCYMLSLNVASERADLLRVESQIITAKQDIRALQTELGTRGRLAQLEEWNADVLALSAPATPQFLDSEVKLARFEQHAPSLEERGELRMAAMETQQAQPAGAIEAPVVRASAPAKASPSIAAPAVAAPAPAPSSPPLATASLVHRASLELRPAAPVKVQSAVAAVPAKHPKAEVASSRIDAKLAKEIGAAARAETGSGTR